MNAGANIAEKAMGSNPTSTSTEYKHREDGATMKALRWHGKENVSVEEVPVPTVTDPKDVVIKVTGTTICGSDLHLYHKEYVPIAWDLRSYGL